MISSDLDFNGKEQNKIQKELGITSLSGRDNLAPKAKPPPTPNVPNAPGSSQVNGPRGLFNTEMEFKTYNHMETQYCQDLT